MAKYIDTEEITPIMAEYVADVFSRKEHLDDISYGYCMEIADTFRRYAERAKQEQPKKSQKSCNDCPHCVDRKDQFGWHFKGCFGGPYNGKFIAEIDKCPLEMEQEEKKLPEGLKEAAENYIAPIENDEGLDYINFNGRDIKDAFIAGAEWQKEQDQPITGNSLEQEWLRYVDKKKKEYGGELPSLGEYGWLQIARHFAEWKYQKDRGEFAKLKAKEWSDGYDEGIVRGKEKMLEEAVEGVAEELYNDGEPQCTVGVGTYFQPGEEVYVIKKEDGK